MKMSCCKSAELHKDLRCNVVVSNFLKKKYNLGFSLTTISWVYREWYGVIGLVVHIRCVDVYL